MKRYILTICMACLCFITTVAQKQTSDYINTEKLLKAAYRYKNGINTDVDTKKAASIYKYLARKGNTAAMCELGKMFLNGDGIKKDSKKAFILLKHAAIAGDTKAMCRIAEMYRQGYGIKQDYNKAFKYYNAAAKRGNANGCYGAGYLIYKGMGVKQDYNMAEKYLLRGSEKKHPGCDFMLGSYYASDLCGMPDYNKAKRHYERAVKEGHGWTVDLTKLGTLDSIKTRNSTRSKIAAGLKWKNKLTKMYDTQETELMKVSLDSLTGNWTGKAYIYDWSNTKVIDEQDINIQIENNGTTSSIKWIQNGKTLSIFTPDAYDGDILLATKRPEKYNDYSWIISKIKFGISKENSLCARVVRRDTNKKELKKPAFIVLQRDEGTGPEKSPFRILNVFPTPITGNTFRVSMASDIEEDVSINIYSMTGVKVAGCGTYPIKCGHNDITLNANLSRGQYLLIITAKDGKATTNIIHL